MKNIFFVMLKLNEVKSCKNFFYTLYGINKYKNKVKNNHKQPERLKFNSHQRQLQYMIYINLIYKPHSNKVEAPFDFISPLRLLD